MQQLKSVIKIHPIQIKILKRLGTLGSEESFSLSELANEVGASSKSHVAHHIKQLEKKGLLKRNPDNLGRFIVFGEEEAGAQFTFLPLLGLAACGTGVDNEHYIIERLPIRSTFIPGRVDNFFLVKAEGDSMSPRIYAGDNVLVESFRLGMSMPIDQIVVCEDSDGVKIKKLTESNEAYVLVSLNGDYPPKVVSKKELKVHGIVRGVTFSKI